LIRTPLNVADNGLSAVVDVDVFDRHFLLPLAAMAVQCLQQRAWVRESLFALI
jgi:hypothetical protein